MQTLAGMLTAPTVQEVVSLGFAEGHKRAWLFENGLVTREEGCETGFRLSVTWTERQRAAFEQL